MRRFFYYNSASVSSIPLLLDLYPATAAYSVRKLRTAYTGACIRVRRSSDNTEQDIGFDISGDLDTAALLTFVGANNGFVSKWYNQGTGGASYDVANTVSTGQPRIVLSGVVDSKGSHSGLRFDGGDNLFITSSAIGTTSLSHFSVSSNETSNSIGTVFGQSWNTTDAIRVFNDRRTDKLNLFINATTPTGSFSAPMSIARNNANQRLLSSFIDASKGMSSFDNAATGGTNTYIGTTNSNGLRIGAQGTSTGGGTAITFLNGYIQEVIIMGTDQSANRASIETNINTYYGIY
jgi:hypothetical protein